MTAGSQSCCSISRKRRSMPSSFSMGSMAYESSLPRTLRSASGLALGARVLLAEAIDAAGGVDELLLAAEEGVARGADVERVASARRVSLDHVAAGAGDG